MTPSEPIASTAEGGYPSSLEHGSSKEVLPEPKDGAGNQRNRLPGKRRMPKTSPIRCMNDVEWGFVFAAPSPQSEEILHEAVDIIMRHAEENGQQDSF